MSEVKEDPPRLFRFHWDCGRNGDLDGLFVAKQSEVNAAIGKKAYFGEVLGKHSEIQGEIEDGEIVLVEEADEKFAVTFGKIVGQTGWNPLEYIQCDECGQLQVDCGCNYCQKCNEELDACKCPKDPDARCDGCGMPNRECFCASA